MHRTTRKVCKHILGLAIVAAVVLGIIAGCVAIHSATKADATVQVALNKTVNDGTTHDMTIVWPSGREESAAYSETITPRSTTYTGPKNLHQTTIDMISFNPLDSANKAGERLSPSTYAEGDRPAVQLSDNGVNSSKAEGASGTGMGGSKPVMGEYLGWGVMLILGLVGLFVLIGVGRWLLAEWNKVAPAVETALESTVTAALPKVPVPPAAVAPVSTGVVK